MHNTLHEFEFRPDGATDYGVSCPWANFPCATIIQKIEYFKCTWYV